MSRILVVRHAESEWNAVGRVQGQGDPPLSDRGRGQAVAAAEALGGFSGPVVASDLRRAAETARIIVGELGLGAASPEPGLREIDVGEWSGLTGQDIETRDPQGYAAWRGGSLEAFPGGESRTAFAERVLEALDRASALSEEVLAVSHGGVLRALERHCGLERGPSFSYLDGLRLEWGAEPRVVERVRLV